MIESIGCFIAAFLVIFTGKDADGVTLNFTPTDAYNCASNGGFKVDAQPCVLVDGQIRVIIMPYIIDCCSTSGSSRSSSINILHGNYDNSDG